MQYLTMSKDMTLSKLSSIVGDRNVDTVLNANSLERCVNVGKAFADRNKQTITDYGSAEIDYQTKLNILNQFVGDSDIYEKAALSSDEDWITLSQYNCFTDAMKIPDEVIIPQFEGILGNNEPVDNTIYNECVDSLVNSADHTIDPAIFSQHEISYTHGNFGITTNGESNGSLYGEFILPQDIFLYSSLTDEQLYFPVYPEGFDDGVRATYDEMPEMLYQYEPWKVYKSSGPREISFTFNFHRDMWTGDHRDGKANDLIRGCMANCYPEYNGSLVRVSTVSLYIHGTNLITGVMTDCKVNWDKPIGLDGFYLKCELSFTISEVSPEALNYSVVRNKGLIG